VIVLLVTTTVVTGWLLVIASHAAPGTDRATAQLDAVRTGLAAGAGAAAGVGLILAFRRQHHQEIATVLTDLDATEQRITELYTRATEQLGSQKAPVRLGGLYALERLAQDNPAHRQTVVYVICAYLRMPFPPTAPMTEQDISDEDLKTYGYPGQVPFPDPPFGSPTSRELWQQEREVRLTAQRILSNHLNHQASAFWPFMNIDLISATLIEFDFAGCEVQDAAFNKAVFVSTARFQGSKFHGFAVFFDATFSGIADFQGATFEGEAMFRECNFPKGAIFDEAAFMAEANFTESIFGAEARARTTHVARFQNAKFANQVTFRDVAFNVITSFSTAVFDGPALFDNTDFKRDSSFDRTIFRDIIRFDDSNLLSGVNLSKVRIVATDKDNVIPPNGSLLIRDVEVQAAACRDRGHEGLQLRRRGPVRPCPPPALQHGPGGEPGAYRA
jgi:uncharacterized protein YjbI with pentapeptide repeats